MNLVEFPGLWGLKLTINRVAFEIFGMPIYWYGIIIAAGFLLAVLLGMRNSKKVGIDPDTILDIVLFAAPAAIIGARLFYVIFSWDLFKDNLLEIFNTRKGGLAVYGGILAAFLVGYIMSKKKKISVLNLLDFAVPYIAMAQGIGRWGNFFNQEAFGSATTLPWRMNSDTVNTFLTNSQFDIDLTKWGVHPTFLYESLLNFAIFAFLIWFGKRKKKDGEVLFLYMLLYGAGRFFIEGLRTDSLMLGNFRISQLLAALFVITFGALFIYGRVKLDQKDDEAVEIGQSQYGNLLNILKEDEHKAQEAALEDKEIHISKAQAENKIEEASAEDSEISTSKAQPENKPEEADDKFE